MKRKFWVILWISLLFISFYSMPILMNQSDDSMAEMKSSTEKQVTVYIKKERKLVTIPVQDYISDVIRQFVTSTDSDELIQLLCILCRTKVYKYAAVYGASPNPAHPGYDFCDDENCCFAFDSQYYTQSSGESNLDLSAAYMLSKKIKKSLEATDEKVIYYHDQLIEPFFCKSNWGHTKLDLTYPYLQSIDSPDWEVTEKIENETFLTKETIYKQLKKTYVDFQWEKISIAPDVQVNSYYEDGSVNMVQVGNQLLTGEVFMKEFHLTSPCFEIKNSFSNKVKVISYGEGDGKGVSLAGAKVLLNRGYSAVDVIDYYFSQVSVKNFYFNQE